MEFDWDTEKDTANLAKHGVSLADAARLDWAGAQVRADSRFDYGETRQVAVAFLHGRLHVCIFTRRGEVYRVVSLRKANPREVRQYERETN